MSHLDWNSADDWQSFRHTAARLFSKSWRQWISSRRRLNLPSGGSKQRSCSFTIGGNASVTAAASGGSVELEVQVDAAPWIAVEEVRVLVNGEVVCRIGLEDAVAEGGATCPGLVTAPVDPYGTTGVTRYEGTVLRG